MNKDFRLPRYKSARAYVGYQIGRLFAPFRATYRKIVRWSVRKVNLYTLWRIANLKPDAAEQLSEDENVLLRTLAKLILPSQLITRNGKVVYRAPALEDATVWKVIEARRSETALERVIAWTGKAPENVLDMLKLTKFIEAELRRADEFEEAVLPFAGHGESGSDNPIEQAKSVLGMIQIAAELFNCTYEEAKNIEYSDVILAIAKRHDEVERLKAKSK